MGECVDQTILWELLDRVSDGLLAAVSLAGDWDGFEPADDADDRVSAALAALHRVDKLRRERSGQATMEL